MSELRLVCFNEHNITDHGSTISGTQTPFQLDETLVCHHASSCCVQIVVVLDRMVNLFWSKGNAGRKPFLNHARSVSSIVHTIDLRVNDPHVGRVSQHHVVGSTLSFHNCKDMSLVRHSCGDGPLVQNFYFFILRPYNL